MQLFSLLGAVRRLGVFLALQPSVSSVVSEREERGEDVVKALAQGFGWSRSLVVAFARRRKLRGAAEWSAIGGGYSDLASLRTSTQGEPLGGSALLIRPLYLPLLPFPLPFQI